MPEGDTIFRAAARMHQALSGRQVTRFSTVFPQLSRVDDDAPLAGRNIERVYAAGKHLLVQFSGDLYLRTHMRMHGSWHLYRQGERWRRPHDQMRVVIETPDFVAVGFTIPVAELLTARELERQPDLQKIGPDLLAPTFDAGEAKRRIRERGELEIADALLNQRVLAGIGNVFKSEILFVAGVNPFAAVASLDDATLDRILAHARRLLVSNIGEGAPSVRATTGRLDPRYQLWVYGRAGKPCLRCGATIGRTKQGPDARSTYWCPSCQASPEASP